MAPLPKRKYAKARQGDRRSHLHISKPSVEDCPQCHQMKLMHRVCKNCGYYRGKQVIEVKSAKAK